MKFLFNSSTDAPYNLALEELIASRFPGETIMLWRNRSAVIVGRNQNTAAEVDAAFVRDNDIQVVRRITGGGAVYHDLGNINYTICVNDRQLDSEAFARNARNVVEVLQSMGIAAGFSGRNDILVDGRKISGSAKSVLSARTLFHGTLLFSTDLTMLTKVLTPDPEKIRAKGIKSVRSRVANLQEFLPGMEVESFLTEFSNRIISASGAEFAEIPADLQQEAEVLADAKYRRWEWNYGSNTAYSYSKGKRFPFGSCKVSFNVVENRLTDVVFCGDFFGSREVGELAALLNGTSPERSAVAAVLEKNDPGSFIQGATAGMLLELFDL